jgi:hypothetical protein
MNQPSHRLASLAAAEKANPAAEVQSDKYGTRTSTSAVRSCTGPAGPGRRRRRMTPWLPTLRAASSPTGLTWPSPTTRSVGPTPPRRPPPAPGPRVPHGRPGRLTRRRPRPDRQRPRRGCSGGAPLHRGPGCQQGLRGDRGALALGRETPRVRPGVVEGGAGAARCPVPGQTSSAPVASTGTRVGPPDRALRFRTGRAAV